MEENQTCRGSTKKFYMSMFNLDTHSADNDGINQTVHPRKALTDTQELEDRECRNADIYL